MLAHKLTSMKTIAILLGRKGSSGIPGKNKMNLIDKPVYTYPLMAALGTQEIDKTFLSSDDDEIVSGCQKYGVENIARPGHMYTDSALFEDALKYVYEQISSKYSKPEYTVVLMCNAPTIEPSRSQKGISILESDPQIDSAVTVTQLNMYSPLRARKLNSEGLLEPFVNFDYFGDKSQFNCDRNSQGNCYFADMSHSIIRSRCLDDLQNGLLPQKWMGNKIAPVYNTFGCDIDAMWQIGACTHWLEENGRNQPT